MNKLQKAAAAYVAAQGYSQTHAEEVAQEWHPSPNDRAQTAAASTQEAASPEAAAGGDIQYAVKPYTTSDGRSVGAHTRHLTAEGRQRISENSKARWAAAKAAGLNRLASGVA